jgi:lysophospholipid acyltransferase (LPLAT)-like uncharacterized protein
MVIAKPLGRVAIVVGEEIRIPAEADRRELGAEHARAVADGLAAAEAEARRVLAEGR